jgi:hypothetical protein
VAPITPPSTAPPTTPAAPPPVRIDPAAPPITAPAAVLVSREFMLPQAPSDRTRTAAAEAEVMRRNDMACS